MKSQSFGVIVLAAIGLVHGLAISPVGEQEERLIKRNNWHNDGKSSVTVSYPPSPHPTPTQDKSGKYGGDGSGKDCDDNEKDGKGKDDKGKDGKGKDGKGGDGKGKDSDYPVKVDPPIDLPPVGVPINKPFPQFDTPPSVPPNKDGDVDGSLVDEYDPRVVLVGTYIERLARQTDPIRIPFTGDEGPVYNEQNAVDILPDDYCIPEDTNSFAVQNYNCTTYRGGRNFLAGEGSGNARRATDFGTYALATPQIYRWRRGSIISISVQRNNKLVLMDLNAGIAGATPAYVAVRASEITAAAMSRAYRYWNRASLGVRFAWTTDLGRSTYLTRTGGVKGTALATADYPAQPNGYQHLVTAWDSMLELEWQPVGPNIISHELGHALGLNHNDAPSDEVYELWDGTGDTIMNAAVSSDTNVITGIPERDQEGARIFYSDVQPPITNGRVVALLRAPQGPNPMPPVFNPPKCRWSAFGACIYY